MLIDYSFRDEVYLMLDRMGFVREPNRYHEKSFENGLLEVNVCWENGGSWLPSEGLYVSIRVKGVTYQDQFVDAIYARRETFDEAFLRERINATLEGLRKGSRGILRAELAKYEKIEGMMI